MRARVYDLGLGVAAAAVLAAAMWLTPAGSVGPVGPVGPIEDALSTPSGKALPTMCWIRASTGHECPTCGMSRSFVAFFHGDLRHAFRFHPMGPILAAGTVAVLVSVLWLALARREPLWGRRLFARALTLSAAGALFAGAIRMLVGGVG